MFRYVASCMGMFLAKGKSAGFTPDIHAARVFKTKGEAAEAARDALGVTRGVPLPEVKTHLAESTWTVCDGSL